MIKIIDPAAVAAKYRQELKSEISHLPQRLKLVGFLAADSGPSTTYANYTAAGCADVGIEFELKHINKLLMEDAILEANADPKVHGILVYYPVFGTQQDNYIKDLVEPAKDIEGLTTFWARRLYQNRRYLDDEKTKKSILPCTPLAIVKLLAEAGVGAPLRDRMVCIFNRSEVVGRPLASMLANDGASVYSFDIDGPLRFTQQQVLETDISREEALARADVIITGVPSRDFKLVEAEELKFGAICLNFSTLKNFHDDIRERASVFIPRVGPMTVTMALRNTLRLFRNYHS